MSIHNLNNLFANAHPPQTGELFEELLAHKILSSRELLAPSTLPPVNIAKPKMNGYY